MARDDIIAIDVESGVSVFDGKPFVNCTFTRVDGRKPTLQVRPMKAREVGLMLLECAVEAERDAATMDFARMAFTGSDQNEEEKNHAAGKLLSAIREHREKFEELE